MINDLLVQKLAMKGLYLAAYAINKELVHPFAAKQVPAVNIPFSKPYITGNEQLYMDHVLVNGDCGYGQKCINYFKAIYNAQECFLTASCADAVDMCTGLLDLQPGNEVIMPAYTCATSAKAFEKLGARPVFADSRKDHPGMDEQAIEALITPNTKAILVVHYGGVATDMDVVMEIARKHNLYVIEDAAQAIDAYYKNRALGTIGHMGFICFNESKNISCGDGAILMINEARLAERAALAYTATQGANRMPHGEATAAYLYAQLEQLQKTQNTRHAIWNRYYDELKELEVIGMAKMPVTPDYALHNQHTFYMVLPTLQKREKLQGYLAEMGISTAPLGNASVKSTMQMVNSYHYGHCLLRLPIYTGMTTGEQKTVINKIWRFFLQK